MNDDALDRVDALIDDLKAVQDDTNVSTEAADAAKAAEIALRKVLDVLLSDAMGTSCPPLSRRSVPLWWPIQPN